MNEIIHIEAIDPFVTESSGIKTYILNIVENVKEYKYKIIGIKISKNEKKINNLNFESIMNIKEKEYLKQLIPINLRFALKIFKLRLKKSFNKQIIQTHRIESSLPLAIFKGDYKLITTMHGITSKYLPEKFKGPKKALVRIIYSLLEKVVFNKSEKIICVSKTSLKYYKKRYPQIKEKFVWIPPMVNPNKFFIVNRNLARRKLGLSNKKNIAMFIGRIDIVKGIDLIINSVKNKKDIELIIIGNGKEEDKYKKIIIKEKISNIRILDAIENEKLKYYINSSNVVCLSSHFEGTPLVILEALSCGVPVISTNVGDIRFIINKNNGIIINSRNSEEYYNGIKNLLGKKLNRTNIRRSIEKYYTSNISKKIIEIYKNENR
ncbi:MAG: hypothetical protein KatS3mg002_1544 [Candidatus Woesearchaeota archaeon]|nr:MAG: hypothetical protein KatS3mg002_1544 [Candidatus Woesearchaeota archaeon]